MARDYVLEEFRREGDHRIDYAAELNDQQLAAVTAPPGPSLVLAGAGSGKTRTLTYRVTYLIEHGVPADRILLLTFTNKAAREMMRRVGDLLGGDLSQLWGGTFHAVGARILRANAERLGFRPDYSILDRDDSETLLKVCLAEVQPDSAERMLPKVEVLADWLSRAANERRPVGEVVARQSRGDDELVETLERLAAAYAQRKRLVNAMDFDDLLVQWLQLMTDHDEVWERYERRFQWILVDEYQDTNQIQSDLIDRLASRHRNVMAVGDDSQSIYSWRGANFRNILDFPRRFPEARVFKIEVNYRSTPEILAVANAAIAANIHQFAKQLAPSRKPGVKPVLVPCEDGQQQAAFVGQRIVQLHEEGVGLSGIAVLYRSHFHALELQLELTRRNIPFVITSGIRFFEQAHIKDVAAWLKLVVNPADELAFKRLVLLLPGVGAKAADKLWRAFTGRHAEALTRAGGAAVSLAETLMAIRDVVPRKATAAWASVATTFSQIARAPVVERPGEMIRAVVEAFYEEYAEESFPNPAARLEDLGQLAHYGAQFTSVSDFLTQLSLLTNLEAESDQRPAGADDDRVRLSTVHQAKGLEFPVVFIIMLGDGLFPSGRSLENPEAAEEERRLFYVAVTRARDELYLTYPLLRVAPGQGMSLLVRSRFLDEIPADLLDVWNLRPPGTLDHRAAPGSADAVEEDEAPF